MIEKDFEEAIDRLIFANFSFKYNKEDHSITFKSYPHYERDESSPIGFHYYGFGEDCTYYLDLWTLEEFIGATFDRYKELINLSIDEKLTKLSKEIKL